MRSKYIAFILTAILLVASTGCSGGTSDKKASEQAKDVTQNVSQKSSEDSNVNKQGLPVVKQPITVTTLYPRQPQHQENFDNMWFNKELTKRTNITIKYELVEASGFQERKNLVLASGNYPDVFFDGITKNDESTFGPQGIFVSLTDYIQKYAPTMLSLFTKYPDVRKSISYADGAIYNMPCFNIVPRDQVVGSGFVNKQWLKNLNMEMPKNLDDLYNILLAFRDKDPNGNGKKDEIPLSYPINSNSFKASVLAAMGLCGTEDDIVDGKYVFVPMHDNYKKYLEYMNKLYKEGLLDRDCFIMSGAEYNAKLQKMLVGVMDGSTPYQVIPADENWTQYARIPMLTSSVNSKPMWPANLRHTRAWGNFVMTNKCKYPEAMVRLVDYFYTDEGTLMVRSGPEAGTWDGEGGWKIVEENGKKKSVITWGKFDSFYLFRLYNAPLNMPYNSNENMSFVMISGDYKNTWLSESILSTGRLEVAKIAYPEVTFTPEEQQRMTIYVDIMNYVKQMEAKFITGEAPMANWDSYLSTLKNMGVQDIAKIKQAAYDRWNSK